jgi:hypothetical protein
MRWVVRGIIAGMRQPKRLHFAVLLVALAAGCRAGALGGSDGGGSTTEADVPCRTGGRFSSSRAPGDPCDVDADCKDPFLACAPGKFATDPMPFCPVDPPRGTCAIRYQLPCANDASCGPGFACMSTVCVQEGGAECSTTADCPAGWSCYAVCPCGGVSIYPRACHPPFIGNRVCSTCPLDAGPEVSDTGDAATPD